MLEAHLWHDYIHNDINERIVFSTTWTLTYHLSKSLQELWAVINIINNCKTLVEKTLQTDLIIPKEIREAKSKITWNFQFIIPKLVTNEHISRKEKRQKYWELWEHFTVFFNERQISQQILK
jgi:hypothetical protein